jgi:pimeloyl-ACP methyl ester carboxylesterase
MNAMNLSVDGTGFFTNRHVTTRFRVEGKGPTVVLIHGVGSRLETWDPIVPLLTRHFRVVRYDLRGFGQSSKIKGRYELGFFVEDFVALIDHLGIERCHVVGFSLGGIIAQAIALAYGERVDRLVLAATIGGVNDTDKAFLRDRYLAVRDGAAPSDHLERSLELYFTPEYRKAHPEVIERMRQEKKEEDPAIFAAAYRIIAETDMIEDLNKVRARTLVATGEFDRASPQMASAMAAEIPDSRLVIFQGLRHNLMSEGPEIVGNTVVEFLTA